MVQNRFFLSFVVKRLFKVCKIKSANNEILWVSFWKFVRGLLPENGRLDCHFWSDFFNFDARSILPT